MVSALTNEVIHGSLRRHPMSCRIHRTVRARVSSMPRTFVGAGVGSQSADATMKALCTVCHDTWYSAATSDTARFDRATALASRCRSRAVSRARAGISSVVGVKERREQDDSAQIRRRFRHHRATC